MAYISGGTHPRVHHAPRITRAPRVLPRDPISPAPPRINLRAQHPIVTHPPPTHPPEPLQQARWSTGARECVRAYSRICSGAS